MEHTKLYQNFETIRIFKGVDFYAGKPLIRFTIGVTRLKNGGFITGRVYNLHHKKSVMLHAEECSEVAKETSANVYGGQFDLYVKYDEDVELYDPNYYKLLDFYMSNNQLYDENIILIILEY